MKKYVFNSDEATAQPTKSIGGKAMGLALLAREKLPTPRWVVVSSEAFETFLHENNLLQMAFGAFREEIMSAPWPNALAAQIVDELEACFDLTTGTYAVRSSVLGEDGDKTSFAGQMDSFLFRKGKASILEAIKACWASAYGDRALHYRRSNNLTALPLAVAVIVQEMTVGEVSGVMFTANPVTGNRHETLISSAWGLADGVVGGSSDCDEFVMNVRNFQLTTNTPDKKRMSSQGPLGPVQVDVPESLRRQATLNSDQVKKLAAIGMNLARICGAPQDIEWTCRKGEFHLLQTRAITRLPQSEKGQVLFDNSNIQESFCGIVLPLTFSFASQAYCDVYSQLMRVMGFSEKAIAHHHDRHQNMLGYFRGRVYYNINNWYEGLKVLPSFGKNKEDMERMMGVTEPVEFVADLKLSFSSKIKNFFQLMPVLGRLTYAFYRIDALVENFHGQFQAEYGQIDRKGFQALDLGALLVLTKHLQRRFLQQWGTPLINDFYVMMMNGRVFRSLKAMGLEAEMGNLSSGEEDIASTEPTKRLLNFADQVRNHPGLRQMFAQTPNTDLLGVLQVKAPEFYRQCVDYVEKFGDRCVGELKLESTSLREDPSFMFSVIKSYLKRENWKHDNFIEAERKLRFEAETKVFGEIRRKHGALRLRLFKGRLNKLRRAIRYRENLRMERTRVFGLFRSLYQEIGRRFSQSGFLTESADIFYLTTREIDEYFSGRAIPGCLNSVVALRKKEFKTYERGEPPHRMNLNLPVSGMQNRAFTAAPAPAPASRSGILAGLACYPGIVKGQVKLVRQPGHDLDLTGKILCTMRTDPGWAPLFAQISGLIIERGSTLSHSAVVAREMGIPAIVGIPNITQLLIDEENVEMDGKAGTVRRLHTEGGLDAFPS